MKRLPVVLLFLSACHLSKIPADNKSATMSNFPVFDKEGHRGCRGLMPENTIPAMLHAIDLGVTTLEMDVVFSRDKQAVVSHDRYFNADITTTAQGNSLSKEEAQQRLLFSMDYDSIKKYDVGLKPYPSFPRQKKMAVHKPLLADLIGAAEAHAKQKGKTPIWYNIETKTTPAGDGIEHPAPEEFVDRLMQVIEEKGIEKRTVIQSFDKRTLQVLHQKYPEVKISYLVENRAHCTAEAIIGELGFTPFIFSPDYTLVTPEVVKDFHQKGIKVVPWTVNTKAEMERLKSYGVDGLITDYPDLFAP